MTELIPNQVLRLDQYKFPNDFQDRKTVRIA